MVDASQAKGLLAACVLLLTNLLRIGKCSLVISRAGTSGSGLKARTGSACGKSSASGEIVLSRLGAVKAALLAPSEEASSLAVLEPIVSSGIVALAACGRDAQVRLNARGELVMVDASQAKGLLAACILLLTDVLRIGKCSLVISRAGTSGSGHKARTGSACGKSSASGKIVLSRLGAVKAALLAPSEEASSLA